jgi:hypothetical protein
MKTMKFIVTINVVLGVLLVTPQFGAAQETIAYSDTSGSFLFQFQRLDQEVKILKRLRELDQEAAAQKKQEPAPFGQIKISGILFGDYFYNAWRDTAVANGVTVKNIATGGARDFSGFQFRRIYLTFDDDVTENVSLRFRLEDDQIAAASGGTNNLFVKDASLKWRNVFFGSDLAFGEQPTPLEISEAAWGYRSLEKVQLDLRGIVTTRDLGLSLRGRIDGEGNYNYWVIAGNNSNTGVESDKYKRYYASFQAKPFTNFQIWVYGDYSIQAPAVNIGNKDKTTLAGLASYGLKDAYSIGLEGFSQSAARSFQPKTGTITGGYESLVASGLSFFAWYNVLSGLAVIARYDVYDPNTSSASNAKGDSRNLFIAGISWKADKSVSIQPNIEYETYEDKPASGTSPKVTYDPSITGRLTLVLQF